MTKRTVLFILGLMLIASGCAGRANEELAKVEVGMTSQMVKKSLGQPAKVRLVRFTGHEDDYLVWQYNFLPDRPT